LPIAIPVFVRSKDEKGKELLEFATALNISAGGALVIVRRSPPLFSQVMLEIPSPPLALGASVPRAARTLRAKMLRVTHAEGYHLLGVKFSRPLLGSTAAKLAAKRKARSVV
jgi:PilZ domain